MSCRKPVALVGVRANERNGNEAGTATKQLLQSVLKEAFEQKGKVYEMNEEVSLVAEE